MGLIIGIGGGGRRGGGSKTDWRIVKMTAESLLAAGPGAMLFYDRKKREYCIVEHSQVSDVLANYDATRYETNYDTFKGIMDGVAHFTARNDATSGSALFSDDVAATSCFYRIEIDNTQAGSITFEAKSGNATISSTTITWSEGDAMSSIVALFTAKNASYITFAALADGKGVGCEVGGYGANTLTVSASTACTVIDCSKLAMLASVNEGVEVGGNFDTGATYTLLGDAHHNFRGATARSILGNTIQADTSVCIGNIGVNYSYRTGLNFAKFKSWATSSGDDTFYSDGAGGSTSSSAAAHVMKKTRFDTEVTNYTGEDENLLKMLDYYTHLLGDHTGEYAELRAEYEAKYKAQMSEMYDAYLMSHMMDIAALSGIVNSLRNYGHTQTYAKADCLNVNYNYKFIPAYPPEYNASKYGKVSMGFAPGMYYHSEPGDLGLDFRDDIMALINQNIVASGGGVQLTNSMYRGSCADYFAYGSWCSYGAYGCFDYIYRYYGYFRCRPSLALTLE